LRSLPDAPSVQRAPQAGKFQTFVNEARSPLALGAVGVNAAIMREPNGIRTGVCPSQAEVTFLRLHFYPNKTLVFSSPGWHLPPKPLSVPTVPDTFVRFHDLPDFLLGQMTVVNQQDSTTVFLFDVRRLVRLLDGAATHHRSGRRVPKMISRLCLRPNGMPVTTPCNQYRHWDPKTSTVSRSL
jgi:hypothetical protein